MITAVQFSQLLQSAIVFGTVIMFGALGEILTQKSGNLNLGVPGIMYLGGIAGLAMSYFYELNVEHPNGFVSLILSFIAAFAAAALGGLIYSFLTITLRANQNVTGLTLTIFGNGLANFFGGILNSMAGGVGQISVRTTSNAYRMSLAHFFKIGNIGKIFFSYGFMAYLAIIIAVVMYYFLNRTRTGLNLRSVGESPATADAAGINVIRYKYLATCIGAGISGLGGLYYSPGHLCHLETAERDLGFLPLRCALLDVSLHSGPYQKFAGNLQDASLRGDNSCSSASVHAQEERGSAAGESGAFIFPRGAVTLNCKLSIVKYWPKAA